MSTQTLDDHPLPGDSGSPAKDVVDRDEEIGKDEVEERSGTRKRRGIEKDAEGEEGGGEKKDEDGKVVKKVRTRGSVSREPATPIERPSRERKTVERYSASTPTPKTVPVKKGSGTKLRDIPNVFFKLSKRKADESLQHLHRILYGKKAKVRTLKRSIFDFSGFVWSSNEDKEKLKLREKLDKCVKDRLFDFCDMFDIPVARATTRKEDILTLLFDFLQSPHVTRDVILEEKEKSGQKRKSKARASTEKKSGEKRRRKKADIMVEENQEEENHDEEIQEEEPQEEENQDEENEENVEKNEEDDVGSHDSASDDTVSEKEADLDPVAVQKSSGKKEAKKGGQSLPNEEKNIKEKEKSKSKENTSKKNRRSSKASSSEKSTPTKKGSVSRAVSKSKGDKSKSQENLDASSKDKNVNKKQATEAKSQSKSPRARKGNGKGKKATGKSVVPEPSSEELHAAVSDILKEVDFNVATLADILRQLATHFGTDLTHRKSEVKGIIEDVVSNMTDVESGSEEEEANETEGDAAVKNPEKSSSGNGEESS